MTVLFYDSGTAVIYYKYCLVKMETSIGYGYINDQIESFDWILLYSE
jgi:hypothetical protein